jgi:hypothetical protein
MAAAGRRVEYVARKAPTDRPGGPYLQEITMTFRRITQLAALAITIAAITASTAAARPAPGSVVQSSQAATQAGFSNPGPTAVKASQPAIAHGFDTGDAGVGAVMTLTVLLALGSTAYLVQRRHGLSHR